MEREKAVFGLRYAGSVGYYAAMLGCGSVVLDAAEPYSKKSKHLNRMHIAGPNGIQSLSVPLVKPNSGMAVGDVLISGHGNWRHNHWGALFSAYGRSPFFDYFADDLKHLYDSPVPTIAEFDLRLHRLVVDFLDLPIETSEREQGDENIFFAEKSGLRTEPVAYYQVWQSKFGFLPDLSILDLLFNEGRAAIFTLLKMAVHGN